jgi:protoheme IX farnesyltransferase
MGWSVTDRLADFIVLTRFLLSFAIAFTAFAGSVIASRSITLRALCAFCGVLFLSCSASALNQYQEQDADALMERTRKRPLPLNRIAPGKASAAILLFALAGFSVLLFGTTLFAVGLGAFNFIWYNLVYTPLKRKTRFALPVGALTGSIPPLIGWAAAGGNVADPEILSIGLFLFLWQVLHFQLLLLKYRSEYDAAGFPTMFDGLTKIGTTIIVIIQAIGLSASTILFSVFRMVPGFVLILALYIPACLLIPVLGFCVSSIHRRNNLKVAIGAVYAFQAIVFGILVTGALF